MRAVGRLMGFALATVVVALSGCALDPDYNFDDSTLFKGHQAWETKRHADDWVVPLGDGISLVGATLLVQASQNAIENATDGATATASHFKETPARARIPEHLRPAPTTKNMQLD
jgi:hypothetical protein